MARTIVHVGIQWSWFYKHENSSRLDSATATGRNWGCHSEGMRQELIRTISRQKAKEANPFFPTRFPLPPSTLQHHKEGSEKKNKHKNKKPAIILNSFSSFCFSFLLLFLKTGSCYIMQTGLELTTQVGLKFSIHLSLPSKCWNYRCVSLCLASLFNSNFSLFSLFLLLYLSPT
jgi:hypothetical protein